LALLLVVVVVIVLPVAGSTVEYTILGEPVRSADLNKLCCPVLFLEAGEENKVTTILSACASIEAFVSLLNDLI